MIAEYILYIYYVYIMYVCIDKYVYVYCLFFFEFRSAMTCDFLLCCRSNPYEVVDNLRLAVVWFQISTSGEPRCQLNEIYGSTAH